MFKVPLLASVLTLGVMLAAQSGLAAPTETPAQRGYRILLTVPLGPSMLTEQQYKNIWQTWEEPARSEAEKASPAEREQMILSRYGFQKSPDRPGPIPQQFTSDGKGNLSENCLACHGGPVAGKVILGLGNTLINLQTFYDDLARMPPDPGAKLRPSPPANAPHWVEAPVRGLNNAWGAAISFMLLRDKNMNVVDTRQFPLKLPEAVDIPLKTPPFWLSRRKTRYYYDAFIGKSHRDIMQFAFSYENTPKQIFAMESDFKDIFAWINSLKAPKYPWPIDKTAANRGRLIYLKTCASCHGTYSGAGHYPERVVPIDEIGTDPVRARDFPEAFKKHLAASWAGDYGKVALYPDIIGYVAPPLDGIWANAPYLHNGSVPTMWDLLTPSARPGIWRRTDTGYDRKQLGLEVKAYDKVPANASTVERRLYYQTNLRGLDNKGHDYPPQGLSDQEKHDLIEYLKTL